MTKRRVLTAYFPNATVRLAAGTRCPRCGIELRAEDSEALEHGDAHAVCVRCHLIVFEVENH